VSARERRQYRSALRDERAADTRDRIVAAARELFASRGFAGTTVAVIAEHAGVAVPTVYATFANKTAIVAEMVNQLVAEVDVEKWLAGTDADPARQIDAFAAFHRDLFSRGRDVWAATLAAAGDSAVAEIHAHGARASREWLTRIVSGLVRSKSLAKGLTQRQAVEAAWMLCGMELYFRASRDLGWTDEEYERWLRRSLRSQLVA
jgi:AcrR family transcriptional regulator